ncbi:Solute carrier family 41 member 2 [Orchesella cincta]|uniref:Solute carrier family 41 member 2 n=1 Tax=Orchesella cincta TaxID=48709 RepID=A0A1D2MJJ2_ORCCI|nr:Solute carrier family 41 member 2 [Orchesella cincta]
MSDIHKSDSGCWDAETEISLEDITPVKINPNPPIIIISPTSTISSNDYIIAPNEVDIDAAIKAKAAKERSNTNSDVVVTSESGNPNPTSQRYEYMRKKSIADSIIEAFAGNIGAIGPGNAVSRASLVSRGKWRLTPEPWYKILRDISFPFMVAGLGMVGAGLLLDLVLEWEVYRDIPELVILVTPFLGLKGNLECTLASRLSTHANIGNMKDSHTKWRICFGNLMLDQLQAIVCGLVASFIALCMNLARTGSWPLDHSLLLTSASIATASMVSLVLGSIMIAVILLSTRFRVNPDNIATPVAGSLGDVVTLFILSYFARLIWSVIDGGNFWIAYIIYAVYAIVVPISFWIVYKNEYVKPVLIAGWVPVLISVIISTGGGVILELSEGRFHDIALFQPLINGIGGNLVSVQASRIATQLHSECQRKILPDNNGRVCQAPWSVFMNGVHATSARVLLFLVIPGHILFVTIAWLVRMHPEGRSYDFLFLLTFVVAALIQVSILLYFAKILSNFMWSHGQDPDIATIPYLTAVGDLLGTGILYLAFLIQSPNGLD